MSAITNKEQKSLHVQTGSSFLPSEQRAALKGVVLYGLHRTDNQIPCMVEQCVAHKIGRKWSSYETMFIRLLFSHVLT